MDFFKPVAPAMPTIGVLILLWVSWGTYVFPIVALAFLVCLFGNLKR